MAVNVRPASLCVARCVCPPRWFSYSHFDVQKRPWPAFITTLGSGCKYRILTRHAVSNRFIHSRHWPRVARVCTRPPPTCITHHMHTLQNIFLQFLILSLRWLRARSTAQSTLLIVLSESTSCNFPFFHCKKKCRPPLCLEL